MGTARANYSLLGRLAPTLVVALCLLILISPARAARTDVVILRNGDHITGEVRSLTYGRLEYKTDDMNTIYIEWERIHHVTSKNRFEVVDTYGLRRWGSLGRTDTPMEVVVLTSVGPDTLALLDVVSITWIKETFLRRLKGSLEIGFSYTRATKTAEATLAGDTRYRGDLYGGKLSYHGYFTQQAEVQTSRYNFGFNLDRYFKRRWTVGGVFGMEHNEELGLNLRTSLSAVGSRILIETNRTMVRVAVGLSATQESYIGSDSTSYNLELPLEASYQRFQYHSPKSNIQLSGAFYPNLTTRGRYRASINVDLSHEVYKDLFFVISFYYDYDNKPPQGSAKDDYRLNTSVRWTFG
jgi:hypothetical protein